MVGRMASMRAFVMVCPWWCFPSLVTRVTMCTAWRLEGWEWCSSIHDITPETLVDALNTVINDSRWEFNQFEQFTILSLSLFIVITLVLLCSAAISKVWRSLSAIHNDRPVQPLDLAVYWTELLWDTKGQTTWDLLLMTWTGFNTTV